MFPHVDELLEAGDRALLADPHERIGAEGHMTKLQSICLGACLLASVLPTSSSAQSQPLPGKWVNSFTAFVFDDKTKTYLPLVDSKDTVCLSEAYFQEKLFHVPKFVAQEDRRPGRKCVVSNEGQSGSTTTWRQVCLDPDGSTDDERWLISISSDELALEHNAVTLTRHANGLELEARNKQVFTLKLIGECDKPVTAQKEESAFDQTQTRQSEQDASDRRYEAHDGGVVRDIKTGLEWTQSDNGSDVNWSEAKRYCAGKGSGWRLGSADELESLYDTLQSTPCGRQTCRASSKFKLTESWFWSNDLHSSSYAWTVYLHVGTRNAHQVNPRYYARALCVRRR